MGVLRLSWYIQSSPVSTHPNATFRIKWRGQRCHPFCYRLCTRARSRRQEGAAVLAVLHQEGVGQAWRHVRLSCVRVLSRAARALEQNVALLHHSTFPLADNPSSVSTIPEITTGKAPLCYSKSLAPPTSCAVSSRHRRRAHPRSSTISRRRL